MSLSQNKEYMSINQTYGQNNPIKPITPTEVDIMRKRLFDNISDLNGNKHRLRPDEYHQLLNYHHYAMNIFDNIKIISQVEMSDPYNKNMKNIAGNHEITNIETINPFEDKLKAVYNRDGRVVIVDKNNHFKGEWEKQFDENVINPPSYCLPPQGVFK